LYSPAWDVPIFLLLPISLERSKAIESDLCILQINVQCHDKFFEVLPDEVENAELTVEEIVSHVLLDLFGEGTVDDVTIHFSPGLRMGLHHCSIQIHAQCSYLSFVSLPRTKENMALAVEKSLCSILKELFGSVKVDSVMLSLFPWDQENDSAPLRRT
jgi:hypothetical protein